MTLRTYSQLEAALVAPVEREGLSRQEIVRRAVLGRYARSGHTDRVEEAGECLADRWSVVIERLGTV